MEAKTSGVVSLAVHGVFLLGTTLPAIQYLRIGDRFGNREEGGFICRLGNPMVKFDRIERPDDQFGGRIPMPDGSDTTEVRALGEVYSRERDWHHCPCECPFCNSAPALVAWPRDIVSYFDRKPSMATSRRGVPRLNTHSRLCASRDTGIEADCTCGLIPARH